MADLTVHRFEYDMPEELSDFCPKSFVEAALKWVDGLVGAEEKVALSTSGGVDSTTVAFLLKEALGDRLHLFFIDDGVRRIIGGREEYEVTAEMFKDFTNFEVIHTREIVLPWFDGIADGTLKRDMFRGLYTITSNRHMASISADWIADGTIAPDIVMTDQKRQIQHNVDLPYNMNKLEVVAPLYKPHVRKVAMELGIPRDFCLRIPCPGPAQLLRVGGDFRVDKLEVCKHATDTVETMTKALCKKLWGETAKYDEATGVRTPFQYFATCVDPEMEADEESSKALSAIAGVELKCQKMRTQAMWLDMSVEEQENRLYAPILWVQGPELEYETLMKLTDAAFEQLGSPRIYYEVYGEGKGKYPVAIRIVESEDVVVAWPMDVEFAYLKEIGKAICEKASASMVAYDISKRPPATIELF